MSSEFAIAGKNLEELEEGLREIPEITYRVTSRAIMKGLHVMKTETWRAVKDEYNIRQHDLYDHLTIRDPNVQSLDGTITIKAPHIPLMTSDSNPFRVSPGSPQFGQGPQATFEVKKGNRESIAGSFVAVMASGHKGLFIRTGGVASDGGDAVKQLFTIGVAEMVGSHKVRDKVELLAYNAFKEEFDRLTELELRKVLEHDE